MKDILLPILTVLYLGFGYWAVQYVKVYILNITAEYADSIITLYGQRLFLAALVGWLAIPIALIHKNFIAK